MPDLAPPEVETEIVLVPSGRPLGELLVGRGLVTQEQIEQALGEQSTSGKRLGNILVELGLLRERVLTDVLAEQLGLRSSTSAGRRSIPKSSRCSPRRDARRLGALPTHRDGSRIEVAVADPLTENLDTQLIELLGSLVRIKLAVHSDLDQAIDRCYAPSAELGDALRMFEAQLEERKAAQPQETLVSDRRRRERAGRPGREPASSSRPSATARPTSTSSRWTDRVRVRFRIDGALHEVMSLPGSMAPSLVSRIKIMADMNIVERRRPQDGQIEVTIDGRALDVRVSTAPTRVRREVRAAAPRQDRAPSSSSRRSAWPQRPTTRYYDLIRSPFGMVICAGPTGSGKTTTLYATLERDQQRRDQRHDDRGPGRVRVPDDQPDPDQRAGRVTFANGLRSILRQDPDAILVGEIRDVETARIAVRPRSPATSCCRRCTPPTPRRRCTASSTWASSRSSSRRRCSASSASGSCAAICDALRRALRADAGGARRSTSAAAALRQGRLRAGAGCNFCGAHRLLRPRRRLRGPARDRRDEGADRRPNAPHDELRALAIDAGHAHAARPGVRASSTDDETTIAEVLRTVYVL